VAEPKKGATTASRVPQMAARVASISLDEVKHVARLARLALEAADETRMRAELDGILAYIDKLRAVDVDGVPPTSHAVPLTSIMRDDEPRPSLSLDEMLANAPDRHGDFFRVPRIIEE
jgi:aspartyl-tRNA(Asn)/glutamyl-tRNA(Gln) amidotransferase subunit C